MHERNCYAARPISTYGTVHGEHYLEFLGFKFPGTQITDPDGPDLKMRVQAIKDKYPEQAVYNAYGASEVMRLFTAFVDGMHGGAGLILPMQENDEVRFKVPAGVAKELATIHFNGFPTWIVTCAKRQSDDELLWPYVFTLHEIVSISEVSVPPSEKEGKETVRVFVTRTDGTPKAFHQLTIQETRERVYYWPDRKRLRPYFLEDAIPAAL